MTTQDILMTVMLILATLGIILGGLAVAEGIGRYISDRKIRKHEEDFALHAQKDMDEQSITWDITHIDDGDED